MKDKKITIKGITVDVRSKDSLYITMNGWTIYIDNSTNEHIVNSWYENERSDER